MKNLIDVFYIAFEFISEFLGALFMIILLGLITILDCITLIISGVVLRIFGVLMIISILYYIFS